MNKNIVIASEIENISIVEKLVDELSIELSLPADAYGNILIAVIEAVTNAIVHGNKRDTSKKVDITLTVNEKELVFRIEDEGPGFDFTDVPDPTRPDKIENPDGRGIFLMTHLADEVSYDKGGAVVFIKFKL